jgi:hypothetical protein
MNNVFDHPWIAQEDIMALENGEKSLQLIIA